MMYKTMLSYYQNINPNYRQETHYNYVKNSGFERYPGSLHSPLLHYHYVSTSLTVQIPNGNAIANLLNLLHTGKERDSETGFSYFGARYYDSDILTGWLSVDPMADKYPSLSPYAYCAWNPVKLVDPDGEQVQRPPLRYGVFNSNQRFVTSNMRQTVYRNSSSTNVKYTRSGCRPVSHDNSMPTYINSKRINEIESQYNMKTKYSKYEEIAKLIVDAKEFVSKAKENTNYSVVYKETNIYTDLENKSTFSYDIVFDNPNIQEKYNSLQNGWNEAYNYIKENYSITAPNGLRHLSSEGLGKMLELGNSPKTQLINHLKK